MSILQIIRKWVLFWYEQGNGDEVINIIENEVNKGQDIGDSIYDVMFEMVLKLETVS